MNKHFKWIIPVALAALFIGAASPYVTLRKPAGTVTDNAVVQFNGTTGELVDAGVVLADTYAPLASPTLTGTTNVSEAWRRSGFISPTQLAGDVNDYDPTGLATASVVRLDSDGAHTITGIAAQSSGTLLNLHNVGSNTITLDEENVSSTAANRFIGGTVVIPAGGAVEVIYDGTSSRWRIGRSLAIDGTSIDYNASGQLAVQGDATLTFTNKTFDANGTGNTLSNVEVADLAAAAVVIESEGIGSNDNDTTLPTSAAVKDYVDSSRTGDHTTPSTTNPLALTWDGVMHMLYYGATGEIDLPAASGYDGRGVLVYNTGSFTVTIDPNGTEVIVRDGTVQTGGVTMTLSSGAGNYVALISDGTRWITLGFKGDLAAGS